MCPYFDDLMIKSRKRIGPESPKQTTSTLTAVGFEPTHPEILVLETNALDHSATLPKQFVIA